MALGHSLRPLRVSRRCQYHSSNSNQRSNGNRIQVIHSARNEFAHKPRRRGVSRSFHFIYILLLRRFIYAIRPCFAIRNPPYSVQLYHHDAISDSKTVVSRQQTFRVSHGEHARRDAQVLTRPQWAGDGAAVEEEDEENGGLGSSLLLELTIATGSLRIVECDVDHRVWRVCDSVKPSIIFVQVGCRGPLPNT